MPESTLLCETFSKDVNVLWKGGVLGERKFLFASVSETYFYVHFSLKFDIFTGN